MERGREGFETEALVDELYREFLDTVLPRIAGLGDETRRFLYLFAWLNTFLEKRGLGRIIITGGFAVEIYTGRIYRTADVDVIAEGCEEILRKFLSKFCERVGRGYLPRVVELELKSIDIVSTLYTRKRPPVKLLINDMHVYLDPPEELVATYLAAWKRRGSAIDRDKALWLLAVLGDRIDMEYLRRRALEEGVYGELEELTKLLSSESS